MSAPLINDQTAEAPNAKKAIRSSLISRNVTIAGHRTSVRLEPDMWNGLMEVCRRERVSLHDICTRVAEDKSDETSLTAAIRVYVMNYYRAACTEDGHMKAGHGSGMRMQLPPKMNVAPNMSHSSSQQQNMLGQPTQQRTAPVSPFMIGMNRMNNGGAR